ncbi:MAG: ATP-binding protein [Lachnospiraceae bacterium]|nr:ATP-binding protein [Lachnospiraceae bacterium]
MEKKRAGTVTVGFFILLAVCMIAAGVVFLFRTVTEYRSFISESRNAALESIAEAVDQTLCSVYEDTEQEFSYIISTAEFREAEQQYLETSDATDLFNCLEKSLLNERDSIQTLLVYSEERQLCSTDRKNEYFLPRPDSIGENVTISIVADYSSRIYLGFFMRRDDLCYGTLMKIQSFYETVQRNSGSLSAGELLLLDQDHTLFLQSGQKFRSDLLYEEGDLDNPLIQMLIRSEKYDEKRTIDYTEEEQENSMESSNIRVSLYPASRNANQIFDIGVLVDTKKEMSAVQRMYIQMISFTALFFSGIAILLLLLFRMNTQEKKNLKEIRLLTEKKDAMEALNRETLELAHHQRLETIGQLTSGIAHDFNNLLTPIMGYSVLVMEKLPPEDTESYDNLLEVYNAARKSKELISRLSDLSRKNSDSTMKEVDPDRMIRNAVVLAAASKPKNVRLVQELYCKDAVLYGNEIQFSQLVINLLINAFHALEEEGGTVRVISAIEGDTVVIRVKDDGPGIPKEIQDKIFQPFFTTKSFEKGTGLGLAIVQQVVEEHKGTIRLQSAVGVGTEFIVKFPAVPK